MKSSDSIYHRLFSHPRMVEDLIREFVPEALAVGVDFSGLERVSAKLHTYRKSADRREGDVIWRLPTRAGAPIYLYLLLEFQSTSVWWMAVRTQVYQGLLWQYVINEKGLGKFDRIPPVMLLVLYNGESRWDAPTSLRELIDLPADSPLWSLQPQANYYVLDMGAFPKTELDERESLAALLFRLERQNPTTELEKLIDEVLEWFRGHPEIDELRSLFGELVEQAISGRAETSTLRHHDLAEVKSMLATLSQRWKEEWRAEGLAKGKAEQMATNLVALLTAKFGPPTPSMQKRIEAADLASLEGWFTSALRASSLSSVFKRHSRRRSVKMDSRRAA